MCASNLATPPAFGCTVMVSSLSKNTPFCLFSLCRVPQWSFSRLLGLKAWCSLFELHACAVDIRLPFLLETLLPASKSFQRANLGVTQSLLLRVPVCIFYKEKRFGMWVHSPISKIMASNYITNICSSIQFDNLYL